MAKENSDQLQLLSLLVQNRDLVDQLNEGPVDAKYFDHEYRMLFHAIVEANDNNVKLTRQSFIDFLVQNGTKKKDISAPEILFNKIRFVDSDKNNFPFLIKNVINQHLANQSLQHFRDFATDKERHGDAYAIKQIANKMQDLAQTGSSKKKVLYEDINNFAEEYIQEMIDVIEGRKERKFVSTGFDELDHTAGVGIAPGTLMLFCGDVGGFKSTMMKNIALNAWKSGKNVLLVPLEEPRMLVEHKLVSRETKIPSNTLNDPKHLTKEQLERVRKERFEVWPGRESSLFIMDSFEQRTSVGLIQREIEKKIEIFQPDVVIVDYIGNLIPDVKQARQDIEIGDMCKALFHMGRENVLHKGGFGVVSGAQLGREALKRFRKQTDDRIEFHSEDVRGAHDYSADATSVYAMMVDPQQPSEKLHISCIKSRFGKKTFMDGSNSVVFDVQADIGLISSSSSLYSGDDAEEILQKIADDSSDSLDIEDNNTVEESDEQIIDDEIFAEWD